jgi:hypothetical protein
LRALYVPLKPREQVAATIPALTGSNRKDSMKRIALALLTLVAATSLVAAAGATPYVDRFVATAVHGDVTSITATGAKRSLTFDRGKVTAVSDTSITLQRADGQAVTLTRSTATRVRGRVALAVGRVALVVSSNGAATRIDVGSLGRAYAVLPGSGLVRDTVHSDVVVKFGNGNTRTLAVDKGRITARTESSLTIARADGQSVTVSIAPNARVVFGWRGARSIARLRTNAWVSVVSEGGKALSINSTAAALRR